MDDFAPTMIHGRDGLVWIAYASTLSPNEWWDIYLVKSQQSFLAHDVASAYIAATPASTYRGNPVYLTFTVRNTGDYSETISLTAVAQESTSTLTKLEQSPRHCRAERQGTCRRFGGHISEPRDLQDSRLDSPRL